MRGIEDRVGQESGVGQKVGGQWRGVVLGGGKGSEECRLHSDVGNAEEMGCSLRSATRVSWRVHAVRALCGQGECARQSTARGAELQKPRGGPHAQPTVGVLGRARTPEHSAKEWRFTEPPTRAFQALFPCPPPVRQVGLRGRLYLAVPQWTQRRADCACARAGVVGLPAALRTRTCTRGGGDGCSPRAPALGAVQRARGVEVAGGPWNETTPFLNGSEDPPPVPHTLTPPPAAMHEWPRGATADAPFYPCKPGRACGRAHVCHPTIKGWTNEDLWGKPAVLPVYPNARSGTTVGVAVSRPRAWDSARGCAPPSGCCQSRRDCWRDSRRNFIHVGGAFGPHPWCCLDRPFFARNAPFLE